MPQYLTLQEASQATSLTIDQIKELIKKEQIQYYKENHVILVKKDEIDNAIINKRYDNYIHPIFINPKDEIIDLKLARLQRYVLENCLNN